MSIHQMNAVWNYSEQKGSSLLLLLAIADNANDDGVAWPGVRTLAKKTRMSLRQTQRLIQKLNESNELAVIFGGGRGHAHKYCILLDKTPEAAQEIKEEYEQQNKLNDDNMSPISNVENEKGDKMTPPIKGDKLSIKGDIMTRKGDILSKKGDKLSIKGDIAMSPEPLEPLKENKKEPLEPVGLDPDSIWRDTLIQLSGAMTKATFDLWLKDTSLIFQDGIAVIVTKNSYGAEWINERLKPTVEMYLGAVAGKQYDIYARPAYMREEVAA